MAIYGPRLISDLRAHWTPAPGEDFAEDRKTNRNMARFKDEELTAAVEALFPGGIPDKHPLDVTAIGLLGYWAGVRDGASEQRKYMTSHLAEEHQMAILYALQSLAPRAEAARIWEEAQRREFETQKTLTMRH
ncbi:hypothetical protein [Nisaea nitritireducens]|uniref:hypothetical protein n=1 Tax=Nisaea nitritireducens TaxID=568392 RepID=UPI001865E2ED|nr:hypothetical protein [Nisaea nitritireducens]